MPYTHEKTSNTIEDKNTKSRTYFHCGPQHKTSGQDNTLKSVIINTNIFLILILILFIYIFFSTYRNEMYIDP